jgi:Ser/Thr protein kinase RdoA (MazF antagonist)
MLEQSDLDRIAAAVGSPFEVDELKSRPGRRATWRARGSKTTAIVKAYATDRACVVADRLRALADGPAEPVLPRVLDLASSCRVVIVSDVPGRPLRDAVLTADAPTCRRVGDALGRWHQAWEGTAPSPLRPHTVEREITILRDRAAHASPAISSQVQALLPRLTAGWEPKTVVHRDLYDEQLLVGERVGLIDLDDAALGPPELDVGNLIAHVELLGRRRAIDVTAQTGALLEGYLSAGACLDGSLLERCRALSLLRLACLNDDAALIDLAMRAVAA